MNADGQHELVVTYKDNANLYHSQIYQTICSSTCSIGLWSVDYTVLSGMEAVPFIFDRFSNGSVSIFTFKNGGRIIVTALSGQKAMFLCDYLDILNNGAISFRTVLRLSGLCLLISLR